ncbi:MAG: hypothetical protein H7X93_09590 [Sphingomonadaceae bacterium]|nr:hypothetical protein [Sphingomonadaceae bacterium]
MMLLNRLTAAALIGVIAMPQPASAQLGGLFGRRSAPAEERGENHCSAEQSASERAAIGSVIGGVLGGAAGHVGGFATYIPSTAFADVLAGEIACRLDPEEQEKAAEATLEATRTEQVGATASWTSDTRRDVSGTSTVQSRQQLADGTTCMDVTDVIIVSGEETTATRRMCRAPGSARYTLAA